MGDSWGQTKSSRDGYDQWEWEKTEERGFHAYTLSRLEIRSEKKNIGLGCMFYSSDARKFSDSERAVIDELEQTVQFGIHKLAKVSKYSRFSDFKLG